ETSRKYFRVLKNLANEKDLKGLSMGMSQDFDVAIQEGATHIRVGSAIFGWASWRRLSPKWRCPAS
ncbi:MAG: hypothetical protein J0H02_03710, partial [Armatimonadetes bacterium]|nr:hypothetical protein [Armatimonadota bacterium]